MNWSAEVSALTFSRTTRCSRNCHIRFMTGLSQRDLSTKKQNASSSLSANYPEFLDVTFTHDLEKISLMPVKTAEDILKLFEV